MNFTHSVQVGPFTVFADPANSPGRAILDNGINYEKHVVAEIRKLAPSSKGFLDVGANLGFHTLVAKLANPLLPTVSAECSPFNLQYLMHNLTWNRLTEATVLPFPLADRPRIIRVNEHMPNMCCTLSTGESLEYPTYSAAFSLDHLILPDIDLVKMDVEGFEPLVLRGASKLLKSRPTIIFELCPSVLVRSGVTATEFLQLFFDMGYLLTVLDFRQKGERKDCRTPAEVLAHLAATSVDITDILATI